MIKARIMVSWQGLGEGPRESSEVLEMGYIVTWVAVTMGTYTQYKIHQAVYLRVMCFTTPKLYFNFKIKNPNKPTSRLCGIYKLEAVRSDGERNAMRNRWGCSSFVVGLLCGDATLHGKPLSVRTTWGVQLLGTVPRKRKAELCVC